MKIRKLIVIFSSIFILITGCNTVQQTLYLQEVEINGPINTPPIHVTSSDEPGSITISPKIIFNKKLLLTGYTPTHSPVNTNGFFQVDTIFNNDGTLNYQESNQNINTFNGNNLKWNIPELTMGFDLDLIITKHFAIFGGLTYSIADNIPLYGGSVGIGFFGRKENAAVRFDAGLIFQQTSYEASTILITEINPPFGTSKRTINFYMDRNKSSATNFFASFTYNSVFEDFPVNFLLNGAFYSQTIFDFEPSQPHPDFYPFNYATVTRDARGEASANYLSFSPALYFNINDYSRILVGLRIIKQTALERISQDVFLLPVIQLDMHF